MRMSEDEMEDTKSKVEEDRSLVAAKRFNCDKIYWIMIVVHQVYNNHTTPLHKGWVPFTTITFQIYLRCQIAFHFTRATIFDNVKCFLRDACRTILLSITHV